MLKAPSRIIICYATAYGQILKINWLLLIPTTSAFNFNYVLTDSRTIQMLAQTYQFKNEACFKQMDFKNRSTTKRSPKNWSQ